MRARLIVRNGSATFRPARWLRAVSWSAAVVGGGLLMLLSLGSSTTGDWTLAVVFLLAGVYCLVAMVMLARSRVLCGQSGLSYRFIRTRRFNVEEIASLGIRPVSGLGSVNRAEIEVVLTSGSRVALEPTLIVRSGPDHVILRGYLQAMDAVLHPAEPMPDSNPTKGPTFDRGYP